MGILSDLGLTDRTFERQDLYKSDRFKREGVSDSEDLQRIAALPRRPPPTDAQQAQMAVVMTAMLRKERTTPCRCAELRPNVANPCITSFFPVQGWYLYEAMQLGGALGMLAAGSGKTALGIFLPMVLPWVKRACLLIPPGLRDQFAANYLEWSQHFRVPNLANGGPTGTIELGVPKLDVLAYTELQAPNFAEWLSIHKPDILIEDECHNLKDKDSVRTSRFLNFFIDFEDTASFAHSGSLTTDSLDNYAHVAALCLRQGSPVPLRTSTVREWAEALDPNPVLEAGALSLLCRPGESARSGFRRRLVETAGVVTTGDAQLETKLVIRERKVEVPKKILEALAFVREGRRPDNMADLADCEELGEQVEIAAYARQVALGFFYRWTYPRGESPQLIDEWFAKRKAWNYALRVKLDNRRPLMDSPALCAAAAERSTSGYVGILPTWATDAWAPWRDIEPQVQHDTEEVWLDDALALDAVAWGREEPGIIWYEHVAFGHRVARLGGFALFEGGDEAAKAIALEKGDRTIVASRASHGTGRNLQFAFWRNLITCPMAGGGPWEQTLARTHRYGQPRPRVVVDVYAHAKELRSAWHDALEDARYVQETTTKAERLLYADISGMG